LAPQVKWIDRVPEMVASLITSTTPPVLDRQSVEKLFGVSKRQALRLMADVGGYEAGNACLVRRRDLVRYLESPKVRDAQKGKRERIGAMVEAKWKEQSVNLQPKPVIYAKPQTTPKTLPSGIEIETRRGANEVRLSFYDHKDLCDKLYGLILFLGNNADYIEESQLERREKAYYSDWEPGREL